MRGRRTNPDSGSVVSSDNGLLQTLAFGEVLSGVRGPVTELGQPKPIYSIIFTSVLILRGLPPR
jgi:hypothetical protein